MVAESGSEPVLKEICMYHTVHEIGNLRRDAIQCDQWARNGLCRHNRVKSSKAYLILRAQKRVSG